MFCFPHLLCAPRGQRSICNPRTMNFSASIFGWIYLAVFTLASSLQAGTVELRSKQVHQGQVSLAPPDSVQVKTASGETIKIPLSEIVRVDFTSPALTGTWSSQDIGEVYLPGSDARTNGALTMRACGWGLWSPTDSFRFSSQPLVGDGQIVAHIAGFDDEKSEVVAGVSIRESLDSSARHASVLLFQTNKVKVRARTDALPPPLPRRDKRAPKTAPRVQAIPDSELEILPWLRLVRQGDDFTGYISPDGKAWKYLGHATVPMKPDVLIGLVAATHINYYTGAATFDHFAASDGPLAGENFWDLPAQGVVLRDGTVLSGVTDTVEAGFIRLSRSHNGTNQIPIARLAAMMWKPMTVASLMQPERTAQKGLFLINGQQLDGELKEVTDDVIALNSVLFGTKRYSISAETLALVFGGTNEPPRTWSVRSKDGSNVTGETITMEADRVLVGHPVLGKIFVTVDEVVEINSIQRR